MSVLERFKIKVVGYNSYKNTLQGFDEFKPINIIVGRNNSGKSTLLDFVEGVFSKNSEFRRKVSEDKSDHIQLELSCRIIDNNYDIDEIRKAFGNNINHNKFLNRYFLFNLKDDGNFEYSGYENDEQKLPLLHDESYIKYLEGRLKDRISGIRLFHRIAAERNVYAEIESSGLDLQSDGTGLTNIFNAFYNIKKHSSKTIEDEIISSLNSIFAPDIFFDKILVQKNDIGKWEINFEENKKGRIELSKSGSGFKTVLQVLCSTILLPKIKNVKLDQIIFAFEELENNLHPALQRKLLDYIRNVSLNKGASFIITTHSNVIIDQFSRDKDAQIIHVKHDGENSYCKKVTTYIDSKGIIDDLDFRASDILQSNGIIWLEGPSDRIYFNHWINLWSSGLLKEGLHYQCMFYGGRLLSHLSASDSDRKDWISIVGINTNAIILIDSDKNIPDAKLNETKNRIIDEFEKLNMNSWVTRGREIENYIPYNSLNKLFNDQPELIIDEFMKFQEILDKYKQGEGDKFLKSKVFFAERMVPFY
jgi:putative ATP-dependent endonuclease of OLD family